jgi:hypothetical protein
MKSVDSAAALYLLIWIYLKLYFVSIFTQQMKSKRIEKDISFWF